MPCGGGRGHLIQDPVFSLQNGWGQGIIFVAQFQTNGVSHE